MEELVEINFSEDLPLNIKKRRHRNTRKNKLQRTPILKVDSFEKNGTSFEVCNLSKND